MEVFNKLTSHPIISKGVKHLVYDTAQFHLDLSQVDYYNLLCHDFHLPIIRHSPAMGDWNRADSRGIDPKRHFELDTVLQFLKSAAKLPEVQQISALRGSFDTDAVTHRIFETKGLGSPLIIEASMTLKILELEFAYVMDDDPDFDMGILRSFLENASSLQEMSLDFQSRLKEEGIPEDGELLHSSTEMYPPFAKWRVPDLSILKLRGINFPYRDLTGLLFANLPQLNSLTFGNVQLTEGRWEDIVEGLSHLRDLSDCHIGDYGGTIFPMSVEDVVNRGSWDHVGEGIYMNKVDRYVLYGGRHPFLLHDAPASASDEYLSRLNETLWKL